MNEELRPVYKRPKYLVREPMRYCPGCSHGVISRLIAEVIEELDIGERAIGVSGVGCSGRSWRYIRTDWVKTPGHGRTLAAATGVKRVRPENIVWTYQGDGDLASIGMAESLHAINRGEKVTVIFENNTYFGATGGQLAPTTLIGQPTVTYLNGRKAEEIGNPIDVCKLFSALDSNGYIERVAVDSPAHIIKAKAAIKRAFETQMRGEGFGFVEVLSCCPSNLHLSPYESNKWVGSTLIEHFPLGVYKEPVKKEE